jgi:hypothetical protein
MLEAGAAAVRRLWTEAGRAGEPRIVTGRYVSLGPRGDNHAEEYLAHYYGATQAHYPIADTPTTPDGLRKELDRLDAVGVTDVVLYPCTADLHQLELVNEVVADSRRRGHAVQATAAP